MLRLQARLIKGWCVAGHTQLRLHFATPEMHHCEPNQAQDVSVLHVSSCKLRLLQMAAQVCLLLGLVSELRGKHTSSFP
jgi:hypothetical protein